MLLAVQRGALQVEVVPWVQANLGRDEQQALHAGLAQAPSAHALEPWLTEVPLELRLAQERDEVPERRCTFRWRRRHRLAGS